jgi:hypothetical protein
MTLAEDKPLVKRNLIRFQANTVTAIFCPGLLFPIQFIFKKWDNNSKYEHFSQNLDHISPKTILPPNLGI